MCAWIGQRAYLRKLFVGWTTTMLEVADTMAHELWTRGSKEVEKWRARHRILLAKQKEGCREVAKPLEIYIAIFVAFPIPAIVMATDYGTAIDNAATSLTVNCEFICEMVLSLRTLATVCGHFADLQCRAELLDHRTLRRKVRLRLRGVGRWCCGSVAGDDDAAGCRVHFNQWLEEGTEFEREQPTHVGGKTAAGIPYDLMDDEA